MPGTALEAALRGDRLIVLAALTVITVLAWADLVWLANDMWMGGMDMAGFRMIPAGRGWMMPASEPWKPFEFGYMLAMWFVMMIGMMTPSVAPMVLIYARVGRQAAAQGKPFAASAGSPAAICSRGARSPLRRRWPNGHSNVRRC